MFAYFYDVARAGVSDCRKERVGFSKIYANVEWAHPIPNSNNVLLVVSLCTSAPLCRDV